MRGKSPNRRRGGQPVEHRHLHIHQNNIKQFTHQQAVKRLLAMLGSGHANAGILQHLAGNFPVDLVVFHQQHTGASQCVEVHRGGGLTRLGLECFAPQHPHHVIKQHRGTNRLDQQAVRALGLCRGVKVLAPKCHHQAQVRRLGDGHGSDLTRHVHARHIWHFPIQQHHVIGLLPFLGSANSLQGSGATFGRVDAEPHACEHVAQARTCTGVVVHHQDAPDVGRVCRNRERGHRSTRFQGHDKPER